MSIKINKMLTGVMVWRIEVVYRIQISPFGLRRTSLELAFVRLVGVARMTWLLKDA